MPKRVNPPLHSSPPPTRLPPPHSTMALRARSGYTAPAPRAAELRLARSATYGAKEDWLTRYGYLPSPGKGTAQLQTRDGIAKAIKAMQRFGGIRVTGEMDAQTLQLMSRRRCSLPDMIGTSELVKRRRRRRYALSGAAWTKRDLTWRLNSFPLHAGLAADTVRTLMSLALKAWSDVADVRFHERPTPPHGSLEVDIVVEFARSDHGDGYPFDGPGGMLAHAFFPGEYSAAGDTHFDDDETWTYGNTDGSGTDVFAVAVHEFGHALGLSHSSSSDSIMRPYYAGPAGDPTKYRLPHDDREGIWKLYGPNRASPTVGSWPTDLPQHPVLPERPKLPVTIRPRTDIPDRCHGHFDAVTQIRGEAFFFKGRYFWRRMAEGHLVSLQPAQIERFWKGFPSHVDKIDAIYERHDDHRILFFRGHEYWVFRDNQMMDGYPRPVTDFGLPESGVDAAFVWEHNGKTYFFKGSNYWRYDDRERRMDPGYPKDTSLWKGVPQHVDAMSWTDGHTYFFKGHHYWKFMDQSLEVERGYPKSIANDWIALQPRRASGAPTPPAARETFPSAAAAAAATRGTACGASARCRRGARRGAVRLAPPSLVSSSSSSPRWRRRWPRRWCCRPPPEAGGRAGGLARHDALARFPERSLLATRLPEGGLCELATVGVTVGVTALITVGVTAGVTVLTMPLAPAPHGDPLIRGLARL
ncbi:unnamed protein product [Lampetra planeri]